MKNFNIFICSLNVILWRICYIFQNPNSKRACEIQCEAIQRKQDGKWTRVVSKSIAKWCSNTEILGSLTTASKRARSISLPVISAAWTILWWECPPSLARCKFPSSPRSNDAPMAINSLILSGPSVQTTWI